MAGRQKPASVGRRKSPPEIPQVKAGSYAGERETSSEFRETVGARSLKWWDFGGEGERVGGVLARGERVGGVVCCLRKRPPEIAATPPPAAENPQERERS